MGKGKRRETVRIGESTYNHFMQSARNGHYRCIAAVIAHLCESMAMRASILKEHHPEEISNEIADMSEYFSHIEAKN